MAQALKINFEIAEWMQKHMHEYKRTNGTVIWTEVLEALQHKFGNDKITMGRARHVYQSHILKQGNKKKKLKQGKISIGDIAFKRTGETGTGTVIIPSELNPMNLDLDTIVKIFKLDLTIWECTGFDSKAWQTTTKDENKQAKQTTNWSIAAKFKLRAKILVTEKLFKNVFENAKVEGYADRGKIKLRKGFKKNSKNIFVPAMYDVHLGKLAWNGETGENYDIKIAEARYKKIFMDLLGRAVLEGFDKSIFVVGQDFFHVDNDKNTTNKGTPLDADVRYKKLLRKGIDLQRWAIMQLSNYAPVDVIYVPGNHDKTMSFSSFEALRGYFFYDKNVTVDENIMDRTYREWGKNILAFSHGSEEGARLFTLIQHEAREMWGRTKYAEWILGHLHREIVKEDNGVVTRTMSSPSGTDYWHFSKGFTGARIAAQGLMYNKNHIGPRTIFFSSIDIAEEDLQD